MSSPKVSAAETVAMLVETEVMEGTMTEEVTMAGTEAMMTAAVTSDVRCQCFFEYHYVISYY